MDFAVFIKKVEEFPSFKKVVAAKWMGVTSQPVAGVLESLPLGARVRTADRWASWSRVNLLDGRWGWIYTDALQPAKPSLTRARLRERILETAELFIGDPYLWGGLSPYDSTGAEKLTGVDCSGLVHLCYRLNGLTIPRDAQDQYAKAEKIKRRNLSRGT